MARNVIDGTGWLVEGKDSSVVRAFSHTSAWERAARPLSMTANSVRIPRIADMGVAVIPKGAAYPEDASVADTVLVSAVKIGQALRIAEEDVEDDKLADYIELKKQSAGSSFAKLYDNAAIGTSAASNGTTVPFTSLYRALTTADATTGYTANANVLTANAAALNTGSGGYDTLNSLLALAEVSPFYDETAMSFIAHPRFRTILRGLKDSTGRPLLYSDIVNGTSVDRVLGVPIFYSVGAAVTATATSAPAVGAGVKGTAGNALLALVHRGASVDGTRKAFESVYIPGRDGLSALTDEDILKVRARKAAGVTTPVPHAVFELIA